MNSKCFNCNQKGTEFYGFIICNLCKKNLRLFTDKTIKKHISKFTKPIYQKEIDNKLNLLEIDFIKKKIKLLDIQNKLKE